ncbi:MAG: YCF48-related protein [Terriglobales bacterium]
MSILSAENSWAEKWKVLGPDGGDARSLAYDPRNLDHIFLGTGTGSVFESLDGGHSWSRFAHLGVGNDYVLDHIVIDPQNPELMFISAWSVEDEKAGDVFRSRDGGKTWETLTPMHGKSVRALALAASDSKVLTAGALDGVYRSKDSGETWEHISPAAEIRDVESIAVDPKDPNVVYAGTWHLAWKTNDGGVNWHHINKGMIEDSDVFSIIIDSTNPAVVYASACSGIYSSDTAGESFRKVQGMPFSARRTRVLKQDPRNPNIVYAGTTEGLWKTSDAGKTWKRTGNPETVVNDVLVDPRNSSVVLLATDRSGMIASDDGAQTFRPSNHGYAHRYVTAILTDKKDPDTIFVSVVNDREWGGVFSYRYGGQHWEQKSTGLGGRDVFTLQQASNGALIAGTNRGIFILDHASKAWRPSNTVVSDPPPSPKPKKGRKVVAKPIPHTTLEAKVNEIEVTPQRWLAATTAGLFTSSNEGKSWMGGPVLGRSDFVAVQSDGQLEVAATHKEVVVSTDGGTTWHQATLPGNISGIRGVTVTPDAQILVASREGALSSTDSGTTWQRMLNGLPDRDISSISYDASDKTLLATSMAISAIFQSSDGGQSWRREADSGYPLRLISVMRGRFVAATPFDGVIVQP